VGELGLRELLVRCERTEASVEGLADKLISMDDKLDEVVRSTSKMEGILEQHISGDLGWRREISERINLSDLEGRQRAKTNAERAEKAKEIAEEARSSTKEQRAKAGTVMAIVTVIAALAGIVGTYINVARMPRAEVHSIDKR